MNLVQKFTTLTNDYAEGRIDDTLMLTYYSRTLVKDVNFTTEEAQIFVDVLTQLIEGCDQLPVSSIKSYSVSYYNSDYIN